MVRTAGREILDHSFYDSSLQLCACSRVMGAEELQYSTGPHEDGEVCARLSSMTDVTCRQHFTDIRSGNV